MKQRRLWEKNSKQKNPFFNSKDFIFYKYIFKMFKLQNIMFTTKRDLLTQLLSKLVTQLLTYGQQYHRGAFLPCTAIIFAKLQNFSISRNFLSFFPLHISYFSFSSLISRALKNARDQIFLERYALYNPLCTHYIVGHSTK